MTQNETSHPHLFHGPTSGLPPQGSLKLRNEECLAMSVSRGIQVSQPGRSESAPARYEAHSQHAYLPHGSRRMSDVLAYASTATHEAASTQSSLSGIMPSSSSQGTKSHGHKINAGRRTHSDADDMWQLSRSLAQCSIEQTSHTTIFEGIGSQFEVFGDTCRQETVDELADVPISDYVRRARGILATIPAESMQDNQAAASHNDGLALYTLPPPRSLQERRLQLWGYSPPRTTAPPASSP
ncbi:MAG: hypothetical protein M1820_008729 [Bogoriella megaspora]|nr:MAG: hypothetical protein M1820_008729 [Bogoriella megaspora]